VIPNLARGRNVPFFGGGERKILREFSRKSKFVDNLFLYFSLWRKTFFDRGLFVAISGFFSEKIWEKVYEG